MTNFDNEKFLKMADALKEWHERKIKEIAEEIMQIGENYFHEREVILPAEELFAQKHGMTADRLEEDWGKRREGKGFLCRQGAELRDDFYKIIDEIADSLGKTYDTYVHEVEPDDFMKAFKEKTGL